VAGPRLAESMRNPAIASTFPRMFAACCCSLAAGIVIYGLLALTSHLVLLPALHEAAWKETDAAETFPPRRSTCLVYYGPNKPIVDNGFSDPVRAAFFETSGALERLTPRSRRKSAAPRVTLQHVARRQHDAGAFFQSSIVSLFVVGYDHYRGHLRARAQYRRSTPTPWTS